ncbi:MAG: hypothetical protein BWY05_00840 [Euryarchaeota archaeon ADurb.Bin165]|nr:MAG: hypothetical protein BWY05_00840 [Euryarchaeota archaeon ADurb.Bin165]
MAGRNGDNSKIDLFIRYVKDSWISLQTLDGVSFIVNRINLAREVKQVMHDGISHFTGII